MIKTTETFKAYAVLNPGEKLQLWEFEPQPLGVNDIEIEITHNGLCHTDIHMRDNDWNISTFPLVAGHEVVGKVTQIGTNVTSLKIGDRVGFGWISNSCRVCDACLRGDEHLCRKGYTGLILGNYGGFANKLRANADFAYKIPDALDSGSAAPLLCAGITVYTPLRTYIKYPGAKVGILGIGGLGHLAIQFAHAMGAEVTAFSHSPDKEAETKQLGAHHFCYWENLEEISAVTNSLDLLLSTVSAEVDWQKALSLLRSQGVFCVLGLPVSILHIPLLSLIFEQKSVVGSTVGGRRLMTEMLEFAALHQIKPMIETMPLSQINEAMAKVAANQARYRIVLTSD